MSYTQPVLSFEQKGIRTDCEPTRSYDYPEMFFRKSSIYKGLENGRYRTWTCDLLRVEQNKGVCKYLYQKH